MDESEIAQNFPGIPSLLEAEIFLGPSEDTSWWWWQSLEYKNPCKKLHTSPTSERVRPGKTRIPDQSPLAEAAWAGKRIEASCVLHANHDAMPSLLRKCPLSRNLRRPEKALVVTYEKWSVQRGKPVARILVYSCRPYSHIRNVSGKWGGFPAVNELWADLLPLHRAICHTATASLNS